MSAVLLPKKEILDLSGESVPNRRDDQDGADPRPPEEIDVPQVACGFSPDLCSVATSAPQTALAELIEEHQLNPLSGEMLIERLQEISESLVQIQAQQYEIITMRQPSTSSTSALLENEIVSNLTGSSPNSSGRKPADPPAGCTISTGSKSTPDPPIRKILMKDALEKAKTSTGNDWIVEHLSTLNELSRTQSSDPPENPPAASSSVARSNRSIRVEDQLSKLAATKDPPATCYYPPLEDLDDHDDVRDAVSKDIMAGSSSGSDDERKPAPVNREADGSTPPSDVATVSKGNYDALDDENYDRVQPAVQRQGLRVQDVLEKTQARAGERASESQWNRALHVVERTQEENSVRPGAMRVSGGRREENRRMLGPLQPGSDNNGDDQDQQHPGMPVLNLLGCHKNAAIQRITDFLDMHSSTVESHVQVIAGPGNHFGAGFALHVAIKKLLERRQMEFTEDCLGSFTVNVSSRNISESPEMAIPTTAHAHDASDEAGNVVRSMQGLEWSQESSHTAARSSANLEEGQEEIASTNAVIEEPSGPAATYRPIPPLVVSAELVEEDDDPDHQSQLAQLRDAVSGLQRQFEQTAVAAAVIASSPEEERRDDKEKTSASSSSHGYQAALLGATAFGLGLWLGRGKR